MITSATQRSAHILVVGIDGIRFDSLTRASTPNIDDLTRAGVLVPVQVHKKNLTVSGPVWATVATGVYMDRHGVVGHDVHPVQMKEFRDFTEVVRTHRPGLETMVAASWFPLAVKTACGPLFSSGGWVRPIDPENDNNNESWIKADDEVAAYAAQRLLQEDLAVSFVYFSEGDVYTHNHGTGPMYLECIERCDARLGLLLEAIKCRPARWTMPTLQSMFAAFSESPQLSSTVCLWDSAKCRWA